MVQQVIAGLQSGSVYAMLALAVVLILKATDVPNFATADMTPMARSFYAESKRVANDRIKRDLGITLRYPDYRAGLAALLNGGGD